MTRTMINQFFQMLGIPKRQAYELWRTGKFPGIKLSHKYLRFEPREVLRALKRKGGRNVKTTA
jgi:hypothetical protein